MIFKAELSNLMHALGLAGIPKRPIQGQFGFKMVRDTQVCCGKKMPVDGCKPQGNSIKPHAKLGLRQIREFKYNDDNDEVYAQRH